MSKNQTEAAQFATAVEYVELKKKITKTIVKMAIGFMIGFIFGPKLMEGFSGVLCGFLFTGIPIMWTFIPFVALSLYTILIKVFIAILGGMLLSPFLWIYLIIQIVRLILMKKTVNTDVAYMDAEDTDAGEQTV